MSFCVPPQLLQKRIIRTALDGITEIVPLIHRSKFFIKRCSYGEVKERLGKIRVLSPKETLFYLQREPGYRQVGYIQRGWGLGRMTVFFNPREAYFPRFRFHTSQSSQAALMALHDDMGGYPDLKVSSLEYTIDFFCESCEAVSNLFYLLRRYMFFPYAKSTFMNGGDFGGWNEPRDENAVYHINMGDIHAKIYERGGNDNGFPKRKGWPHKNVDRVRLEFTFERNFLARNHISDISDLIKDTKFYQLCSPRIQFKNFKASSPFPKDWENYTAADKDGNIECLMEENFKAKREGNFKNPLQYLEDTKMLYSLKKEIRYEIRNFDNNWSGNYYATYLPML